MGAGQGDMAPNPQALRWGLSRGLSAVLCTQVEGLCTNKNGADTRRVDGILPGRAIGLEEGHCVSQHVLQRKRQCSAVGSQPAGLWPCKGP